MLKKIVFFAVCFFSYAECATSYAQTVDDKNPFCRSISSFETHLQTYSQGKVWSGSSNGVEYDVYSSKGGLSLNQITEDGATWTVAYTASDGRKCLIATGTQWKDTFTSGWHVEKSPIPSDGKDASGKDRQKLSDDGLSTYLIGNTRLYMVGNCNNGYSLDEVLNTNPFVVGEGRIEAGSDRAQMYRMSVHHADYIFILSSVPSGEAGDTATWAMLFPLPVPNDDFTVWACTYIEAVGIHGQRWKREILRSVRKKARL